MLREAALTLVLLFSATLALPSAPALPAACDAIAGAEESLQDDAQSGVDAPDAPQDALRVGSDGYYSGYLSAVGHATADREDWYVYAVPEGIDDMKVNVTVALPGDAYDATALPANLQAFLLTVFPPQGAPLMVSSYDGTLVIAEPASGDYLVRVTATTLVEIGSCGSGAPLASPASPASAPRNHGFYLGCDPLCAEGA